MQVFATVHHTSGNERLKLSPATLSRFTNIACSYSGPADIRQVLLHQLRTQLCKPGGGKDRGASAGEVQGLLDTLCSLQDHVQQELRAAPTIRQLLRCVSFVALHTTEQQWLQRLLVGFRWLVLDALCPDPERQLQLAQSWLQRQQQPGRNSLYSQEQLQQAIEVAFQLPDQEALPNPSALLRVLPGGYLQLGFTGVAAAMAPTAQSSSAGASNAANGVHPAQFMQLSCTPWLVVSMARIMAAATVQGSLLLEGPPGVGKTAAVQEIARLLGYGCERINLSANTSLEQLIGSFIPKMVDGQREFAWQDGVMVRAIRAGKWLLLDEINLAPPEVLAAVAPLLDRWVLQALVCFGKLL